MTPDLMARTATPVRASTRPPHRRSGQWAAWAFLTPIVIYLIAFYAWPLYRNLDLSLRHYTVRSFVQGNAPFNGLDNYTAVIKDPTFGPALLHTIVFTGVSLIFQFTIGMALAVFFVNNFRLSTTLRALFLVPWLLPLIVSASTWSWMLNSDSGIVNSALGAVGIDPVNWLTSPTWALTSVIIANIWIGIPFNLVVLYSGLQAIPPRSTRPPRSTAPPAGNASGGSPSPCCAPSPRSSCSSAWSTPSRSSTSSGS